MKFRLVIYVKKFKENLVIEFEYIIVNFFLKKKKICHVISSDFVILSIIFNFM